MAETTKSIIAKKMSDGRIAEVTDPGGGGGGSSGGGGVADNDADDNLFDGDGMEVNDSSF